LGDFATAKLRVLYYIEHPRSYFVFHLHRAEGGSYGESSKERVQSESLSSQGRNRENDIELSQGSNYFRPRRYRGYRVKATPDRLREVNGIGPVRAASILAASAEQKAVREIMVFLPAKPRCRTARAVRIFKTYGSDAIQVMAENPYQLARDIRGIGFKTQTPFAMKLGIEKFVMIPTSGQGLRSASRRGHRHD
jgi:hypothetical protein